MLDIKNIRRNEICACHQGAHCPVGMVNGMVMERGDKHMVLGRKEAPHTQAVQSQANHGIPLSLSFHIVQFHV